MWTARNSGKYGTFKGIRTPKPAKHYRRLVLDFLAELGAVDIEPALFDWEKRKLLRRTKVIMSKGLQDTVKEWDAPAWLPENEPTGERLTAYNAFLANHDIRGCLFPLFGRHRKTKNGRRHGRIYATGPNNIQTMGKIDRLGISIDGEAVREVDIAASHLTIVASLKGKTLPVDPYAVAGFERDVVKAWFLIAIASRSLPYSWQQSDNFRVKGVPRHFPKNPKRVGDAVLALYPWFGEFDWDYEDVVWRESDVILRTIYGLSMKGVVALPVHDSLVVPTSQAGFAAMALEGEFAGEFGVIPRVRGAAERHGIVRPLTLDELSFGKPVDEEKPVFFGKNLEQMTDWIMEQMGCPDSIPAPKRKSRGRPRVDKDADIAALLAKGKSLRQAAKEAGVSVMVVRRVKGQSHAGGAEA